MKRLLFVFVLLFGGSLAEGLHAPPCALLPAGARTRNPRRKV